MADREFSVEEANALLPTVSEALVRIREARQVVLAGGERVRRSAPTNGGGREGKEYWEALATLRREIESLNEQGIILRDPESGLIDFPSERDGRQVFLCWRLGETNVGFWHGPESGFAGRRPL
jgi:hypothetical protein